MTPALAEWIPERVLEPFTEASFRSGVLFGGVALVVGVAAGLAWRASGREGAVPVSGLLLCGAAIVALEQAGRLGSDLVPALMALGVGGLVVDVAPTTGRFLPLLALPGAWLLAATVEADQDWLSLAVGLTAAFGGALVSDFDRRWSFQPPGPGLVVVSFAGVFLTVPETAEALPVLGAALPLTLIGWPLNLARLGAGGSLASTGLLAWVVAQGGMFRDSAVVGGLACLAMLVAEPLGRALVRRRVAWPTTVLVLVAVATAHVVMVILAARVAGLREQLEPALALAVLTLVLGIVVSAGVWQAGSSGAERRRRSPQRETDGFPAQGDPRRLPPPAKDGRR